MPIALDKNYRESEVQTLNVRLAIKCAPEAEFALEVHLVVTEDSSVKNLKRRIGSRLNDRRFIGL